MDANQEQQQQQQRHFMSMNRAISLGNVSRQHGAGGGGGGGGATGQSAIGSNSAIAVDHRNDTGRQQSVAAQRAAGPSEMRRMTHAALATPSRARLSLELSLRQRQQAQAQSQQQQQQQQLQFDRNRSGSIGYQLSMQPLAPPQAAMATTGQQADSNGHSLTNQIELDTCSAASSPEPMQQQQQQQQRNSTIYWESGGLGGGAGTGQSRQCQADDTACYHEGPLVDAISASQAGAFGRQSRLRNSLRGRQRSLHEVVAPPPPAHTTLLQQSCETDEDADDHVEFGNGADHDDDDCAHGAPPRDMSPSPSPPPPPPPPPHTLSSSGSHFMGAAMSNGGGVHHDADGDIGDDEDDNRASPRQLQQLQQQQQPHRQVASFSTSAHASLKRQIHATNQERRARTSGAGSRQLRNTNHAGPIQRDVQHLSLINQLQQLEQVQSLHAKQVAAAAAVAAAATSGSTVAVAATTTTTATNDHTAGLHEFFSLPLSVQLSALLARNLAELANNQQRAPGGGGGEEAAACGVTSGDPFLPTSQIEDYLNTLNSSSVAVSSRRSFKLAGPASASSSGPTLATAAVAASSTTLASKQPLQATNCAPIGEQQQQQQQEQQEQQQQQYQQVSGNNSRGGTMRKQQVKLQNLQSLISRLQKLHNQTVLQQRFDAELANDDERDDDDDNDDDVYYDNDDYDDENDDEGAHRALSMRGVNKYQLTGGGGGDATPASRQSTLGRSNSRQSARRIGGNIGGVARPVAAATTTTDQEWLAQSTPTHNQAPNRNYNQDQQQQQQLGGARSRRAQHMRRSDSHRSRYDSSAGYATNKNDLVYSMSDSEDGGAYVSQMLTRTSKYLRDQKPNQTRVSQANLKAGTADNDTTDQSKLAKTSWPLRGRDQRGANEDDNVASNGGEHSNGRHEPVEEHLSSTAKTPSPATDVQILDGHHHQQQQQQQQQHVDATRQTSASTPEAVVQQPPAPPPIDNVEPVEDAKKQ